MKETRFVELLAAYGAELSRWPLDERLEAEEFLAGAPHRLKDIWESERVFDRLLALEKDVPASVSLETKVLAASPGRRPARASATNLFGRWRTPQWAAGGAIAASLALGFAVGYAAEPAPNLSDAPPMLMISEAGSAAMLLNAEPNN